MTSKSNNYSLTMDDIRPFMSNAATEKSGNNPTSEAIRILGYEDDAITIDWKWWNEEGKLKQGDFSIELDRFLFNVDEIYDNGQVRFIDGEDDTILIIRDFPKVQEKLLNVRKVASVLCDTDLMLSSFSIKSTAERAIRETFCHEHWSQVRSNEALVRLSPDQWERVCRLFEVIHYRGKAHRMFVHDPWVTMTANKAVAIEVSAMDSNRNWNFYDGICVFVPDEEDAVKYEKDFPIDYWD